MAKQGERYNPKTKTGWKYENGKTVYYKKGKILNNRQQLLSLGKDITAPLVSGAQTIRDKLRISPLSETGESVFEYNKRIDKAQDEYDDSAEVAEFQKYQKKANIYNKAEVKRVQTAKDFEKEAQMYADETGRSVEFAKRMLRGEHAENTVIGGNVTSDKQDQSGTGTNVKPAGDSVLDREEWLKNTRNSPAARAGMSDDMRWEAQLKHRQFKEDRRSSKEARIKRRDERLKKKKNPLKINSRY